MAHMDVDTDTDTDTERQEEQSREEKRKAEQSCSRIHALGANNDYLDIKVPHQIQCFVCFMLR